MKKIYLIIAIQLLLAQSLHAQDPYLGEIRLFPFGVVPKGWVKCDGQILGISQNSALFSLLGVFYGGNGSTNFALPNLNGKILVGQGQGQGLYPVSLGQSDGVTTVALNQSNLPIHSHQIVVKASTSVGTTSTPSASTSIGAPVQIFNGNSRNAMIYNQEAPNTTLNSQTILMQPIGSSVPIPTRQPVLAGNYCIAISGAYPPRN